MNYLNSIGSVIIMAFVGGCASPNKHAINETIGPAPFDRAVVPNEGFLQVFSANEQALGHLTSSDFYEKEEVSYELAHTDYTIYKTSGELLKKVRNAQNLNDATPALVSLSAGQFKVVAKAQTGDGWTITYDVHVMIKTGHKTVVHLEPDWKPSEQLDAKSALVRGHDGRIIGWLAEK